MSQTVWYQQPACSILQHAHSLLPPPMRSLQDALNGRIVSTTAGLRANGTRPHSHRTHTLLPSLARALTLVAGTKSALVNKILLPVESREGLGTVYLRRPFDNRLG